MSSSRLDLKRSLSGLGGSADGGGKDGSTAAQLSLVKKRKAALPKRGNGDVDDVDDSPRDARGKDEGAAARTMGSTKSFGDSNEDYEGKHGRNISKSGGGSWFSRIDMSGSPLCEDSKRPCSATHSSATPSSMPSAGGGGRDWRHCSGRSPSPQRRSRSREREVLRCNRGASKSRSRSADRGRRGEASEPEPESEPEPSLEDINHCRVPRQYLEQWANEPSFEKAVLGRFIRVSRGVDHEGKRSYDMAQIVGVGTYKRRYNIGNTFTTKCLKISSNDAKVGDQCMDVVSNSGITEEEFAVWKEGRRRVKAPIALKPQCTERLRARTTKITQNHKDSVATMVKERQKEGVAFKNTTLTRITLSNSLKAAVAAGKVEEADFCRKQLAKLDAREARVKEFINIRKARARAVTERARSLNVQTDASISRKRRRDEAKSSPDDVDIDPYKRRSCRPKIIWTVRPASGTGSAAGAGATGSVKNNKK